MRWAKGSVVLAGLLSASVGLGAIGQAGKADKEKTERQDRTSARERVIVRPQIEILQGDRAQLGVSLRDLDEASAREHKLPAPDGALVEQVEPGSAAEQAGIKAGDVIASFDGERVRSVRHLQRLLTETPPDRAVKVTVMRDGRRVELTATPTRAGGRLLSREGSDLRFDELERSLDRLRDLPRAFQFEWRGEAPGDLVPRTPREPLAPMPRVPRLPFNGWTSGAGRLGVVVQDLTPQLGEYFGSKEGVLVTSVTEGSAAAQAGVKAGDIITGVNGKPVKDVDSLIRLIREQPDGQDVSLSIVRDRKSQTLKVKLLSTRARPI